MLSASLISSSAMFHSLGPPYDSECSMYLRVFFGRSSFLVFVDVKLYLEDSHFLKKESELAGSNFFENLYINILMFDKS